MKNFLYFLTIVTLMSIVSCKIQEYSVDTNYVKMVKLDLTFKEEFKLHWLTIEDSSYVKYSPRCECFYYDSTYNYSLILNP